MIAIEELDPSNMIAPKAPLKIQELLPSQKSQKWSHSRFGWNFAYLLLKFDPDYDIMSGGATNEREGRRVTWK